MTGDIIFGLIMLFLIFNAIGLIIIAVIWNRAKYIWDFNDIFDFKEIHDSFTSLNWFGTILLWLFFTAMCPIAAVVYWFCKLCTVGRK